MTTLEIGKKAPAFSLKNQEGKKVSLKDFKGKNVALYFYPKDMTPTCTQQACNLRDHFSLLQKHGIVVIGVSADSVEMHTKFIGKHELPFILLSDESKEMLIKYGVWGEKSMYGKKYMGIFRTTFLIDEDGKIFNIIQKVTAKTHAEQILKMWGFIK